jgi:hypothetical protein
MGTRHEQPARRFDVLRETVDRDRGLPEHGRIYLDILKDEIRLFKAGKP